MSRSIAILGSTGSIGKNALKVIEALGGEFKVTALSAHSSSKLLAEQTRRFKPEFIALTNSDKLDELRDELSDYDGQILSGPESMVQIAELDQVDIVITAVVGAAGLGAVMAAARKGKILAIANKEPLVIAGRLLTETAKKHNATILPIDSEHSAIFQCLQSGRIEEVNKIILTGSGGPFRNATDQQLADATVEDALAHPTWNMGPKITVDSATMMNKALEVIEAVWLFGVDVEKIDVLIHPQSIVHSMVEFVDGSVIAQMAAPDMCVPIQYALTWPKRQKGIASHLKLDELGTLSFEKPDAQRFRALKLGFEIARQGGSIAAVFNAANEAAVELFLAEKIKFPQIVELIERCLDRHSNNASAGLEELLEADKWARQQVRKFFAGQEVKNS